jgi:hypothetical protein
MTSIEAKSFLFAGACRNQYHIHAVIAKAHHGNAASCVFASLPSSSRCKDSPFLLA